MGALRTLFIIMLIVHLVVTSAQVAFALMEVPPSLPISSPLYMTLFALGLMGTFADLICIIATQSAPVVNGRTDVAIGRPHRLASQIVAYIFLGLAVLGHFFLLFTFAMSYGKANTDAATVNNPANDIEYCCVFTGHSGCPAVPCTAGFKSNAWELRVNWRFLVLFWSNFGLLIFEIVLLLLLPYSSNDKMRLTTLGALRSNQTTAVTSSISTSTSSISTPSAISSPNMGKKDV
jgi:hypothetical protein